MNAGQKPAVAPFRFRARGIKCIGSGGELPAQHRAGAFQAKKSVLDIREREIKKRSQIGCGNRTGVSHPTGEAIEQRVFPRNRRAVQLGWRCCKKCHFKQQIV